MTGHSSHSSPNLTARGLLCGLALLTMSACTTSSVEKAAETSPAPASQPGPAEPLRMTELVVGRGRPVVEGDVVRAHYTMSLESGEIISTSQTSGQPLAIKVGGGGVIRGWDEGLVGMREGGSRTLHIPAHLAFGAEGRPPLVPAGASIRVDVQLAP